MNVEVQQCVGGLEFRPRVLVVATYDVSYRLRSLSFLSATTTEFDNRTTLKNIQKKNYQPASLFS